MHTDLRYEDPKRPSKRSQRFRFLQFAAAFLSLRVRRVHEVPQQIHVECRDWRWLALALYRPTAERMRFCPIRGNGPRRRWPITEPIRWRDGSPRFGIEGFERPVSSNQASLRPSVQVHGL